MPQIPGSRAQGNPQFIGNLIGAGKNRNLDGPQCSSLTPPISSHLPRLNRERRQQAGQEKCVQAAYLPRTRTSVFCKQLQGRAEQLHASAEMQG